MKIIYVVVCLSAIWFSCRPKESRPVEIAYDDNAKNSVLMTGADSLAEYSFSLRRNAAIRAALQNPVPVMLCTDSLSPEQQLAQALALRDPDFTQNIFTADKQPLRNEIFGVYPARESDFNDFKGTADLQNTFRVEMYNYALNSAAVSLVDIERKKVLFSYLAEQTQPDVPDALKDLAVNIAANAKEVQDALGFKPGEKDALMASTKTSLNKSRCERSRHLCVAPTFVKGNKALWAIVDLTEQRLVGIRWTNVGSTGPAASLITERKLQDDKITSCYCEAEQPLKKNGWQMKYMLTSSDGLRISELSFNGKKILRSAKLVDWHVSYSGTDGFGYSDAIGCPYFSQAAVVAWEIPQVSELKDENNRVAGFTLEQTFRSEGWPRPCNYNYRQRYEFYNDGRFRIAAASVGRGCGNTGTYRPVFRVAFDDSEQGFYQYEKGDWQQWPKEKWGEQTSLSDYSNEGFLYRIGSAGTGYNIAPGNAQFNDKGRGDFSFAYVTKYHARTNEGETDMLTIGPCCNTDYRQGPEKFIDAQPEDITKGPLVFWYVAQLRNDDRKGNEYCWAESVLENGVYRTKTYPCFSGPMFVPIK